MKRTGPTNIYLRNLITQLKKVSHKENAPLWLRIASDLEKPTRQRRIVNLSRISRYTKENDVVVVPGKVLGAGELKHPITVVAFSFSGAAKERIEQANGKAITIEEMLVQNPKGKGLKIIG